MNLKIEDLEKEMSHKRHMDEAGNPLSATSQSISSAKFVH
jgi:hypothetical protein